MFGSYDVIYDDLTKLVASQKWYTHKKDDFPIASVWKCVSLMRFVADIGMWYLRVRPFHCIWHHIQIQEALVTYD